MVIMGENDMRKCIALFIVTICCGFAFGTEQGYSIQYKYCNTGSDEAFIEVLQNEECVYGWTTEIYSAITKYKKINQLKLFCNKLVEKKLFSEAYREFRFENLLYYVLSAKWKAGFDYLINEYPELIQYSSRDDKSGKSDSPIALAIALDDTYYYKKILAIKDIGFLNDDRVRLRKGPGTNTENLGVFPKETCFKILGRSGVKQTIEGVTDEWIKVRLLNGIEGYFFGQFVQIGVNPLDAQVGNESYWDCGIIFKKNLLSVCKDDVIKKQLIEMGMQTVYNVKDSNSGFSRLIIETPKKTVVLYDSPNLKSASKEYGTNPSDVYEVIKITFTEPRWFFVTNGKNSGWIKDWQLDPSYYEP